MPIEKLPSGTYRFGSLPAVDSTGNHGGSRGRCRPALGLDEAKRVEFELRLHVGHSTAEGDMPALADLIGIWIANGEAVRAATTQYSYRSVVAQ